MNNKRVKVLYIMGAGRSGTTAIATFLGNHPQIQTLGEMHQFLEHLEDGKQCSCGAILNECPFWSKVIKDVTEIIYGNLKEARQITEEMEYHSSVWRFLTGTVKRKAIKQYVEIQNGIFDSIAKHYAAEYYLDSAKYIGRNMGLRKSRKLSIRTVYVVRDVRGVINSFSKNVQSSRSPLSTIFYYSIMNITAAVVCFLAPKGTIIKLRYEDFVCKPVHTLERLGKFLQLDMGPIIKKMNNHERFDIGHFIGGNRLKASMSIKLNPDDEWRVKQSRIQQVFYYILAAPSMVLNKYKV